MTFRRDVLKGIGSGAAVIAMGGVGVASADDGEAKIRVAHASPDAPEVEVTLTNVDNEDISETVTVEFTDVTGYLEVPTGDYDVEIPAAGFSTTVTLDADDYTAAAIGELSPEDGDGEEFTVDVFEDKLGRLFGDDGRVRIYHASPDAGEVDVAVADDNDEPDIFLAEGLTFGNAGPNVEVGAGTYPVAVYPAGSSEPVFGPADVEVKDGEVLTAFAEGELEPEGDEPGFEPVLAYEEAAPFGNGNGGGGRGE